MLRQARFAFLGLLAALSPASAQTKLDIPGIGTIQFGFGKRRVPDRASEEDDRFEVIDRKPNDHRSREVTFRVGRREGEFEKLRVRAIGKVLRITGLEITFGNGRRQRIDRYEALFPGEETASIDLTGEARRIREVVVYKRPDWRAGRGEVELLGLPPAPAGFGVVATERHGRADDEIIFDVGRTSGRWDEIRLRALDRPVFIDDLVITFGDRSRQKVSLNTRLEAGQQSRIIDLKGQNRAIRTIEVEIERTRRRGRGRLQLLARDRRDQGGPRAGVQQKLPPGWVMFGSQVVSARGERDSIKIGRDYGLIERVAFRALHSEIHLREFTIVYGNGARDRRDVDLLIPAGYGTRAFDLKGSRDRTIREIEFRYRARPERGRGNARLQVFGEYSDDWLRTGPRDRRQGWILLGAQSAGIFSTDDDAFLVGKRFGNFRAIRVTARDNNIRLYGMRVTYENGEAESVPIYGSLPAGTSTKTYDLRGNRRFIRRIDLKYRTSFNFDGDGTVEIWGRR